MSTGWPTTQRTSTMLITCSSGHMCVSQHSPPTGAKSGQLKKKEWCFAVLSTVCSAQYTSRSCFQSADRVSVTLQGVIKVKLFSYAMKMLFAYSPLIISWVCGGISRGYNDVVSADSMQEIREFSCLLLNQMSEICKNIKQHHSSHSIFKNIAFIKMLFMFTCNEFILHQLNIF